jgi:hypothetical protein
MDPSLQYGIAALNQARKTFLELLEDIPADKLCFAPPPMTNHALWQIGHLAMTDNYFLTSVLDEDTDVPDKWNALFGYGSQPVADASKYPNPADVRQRLDTARAQLLGCFERYGPQVLATPLPDDLQGFAATRGALPAALAWHEGLHTGQLTVIRRALGHGPKYG